MTPGRRFFHTGSVSLNMPLISLQSPDASSLASRLSLLWSEAAEGGGGLMGRLIRP